MVLCLVNLGHSAEDHTSSQKYWGQILNGEELQPVVTLFTRTSTGKIAGRYVMGEEDGDQETIVTGRLSDCLGDAIAVLTCQWHDKYGSGFVRIMFSSDYRSFTGYWGTHKQMTLYPWNGEISTD
jgi:hypothetical protein